MDKQKTDDEIKKEWETARKVIEETIYKHSFKDALFTFLEEEDISNPSFVSEDLFKGYILYEMKQLYPYVQKTPFRNIEKNIEFKVKRDFDAYQRELNKSISTYIKYDVHNIEKYDPEIYSFIGVKGIVKLIAQYVNTQKLHNILQRYAKQNEQSIDDVTSRIILKYINVAVSTTEDIPPTCKIVLERYRLKDIIKEELEQ